MGLNLAFLGGEVDEPAKEIRLGQAVEHSAVIVMLAAVRPCASSRVGSTKQLRPDTGRPCASVAKSTITAHGKKTLKTGTQHEIMKNAGLTEADL
jgi:hypothetical protein